MTLTNIQLSPQLVQAVRDAVDIVSVAGDFTRLAKNGNRYKGLCPFHKEKTPSFSVDPDRGLYYCFGCGAGGDAIKLHMEQTGDDFPAAIESLGQRFGIALPKATARPSGSGRPERDIGGALEAAFAFFRQELEQSPKAQAYLRDRDMPPELIERYGLGYAPDEWDRLLRGMTGQVPQPDLEAAGLIGRSQKSGRLYDRFRDRLMFPIHTPAGRLAGFGGRTLGDDRAKYVNTSETAYFHKGNLLYGLHQAKKTLRESGRALLVEGYFDVLGAAAADLPWAIAGMGTALTSDQVRLLDRFVDEVVIAYDGDAAGEKAFERALPLLLAQGLVVRRARFPEGHDPDSLRQEQGVEAVVRAVEEAEDAVWMLLERRLPDANARTPHEKNKAAIEMVEVLRLIRDPLVRQGYASRAAQHLGVPEHLLYSKLNPAIRTVETLEVGRAEASSPVRTIEEMALFALLHTEVPVDPEQLPPPEAFFDAECRNIFEAFCALYEKGSRPVPTHREVLARLGSGGGAIDRAAKILLEEAVLDDESSSETAAPAESELSEILRKLERRWWKQRRIDLVRQIREALGCGDAVLARQLGEEKNALTRRLHPGATGTLC